MNWSLILPSMIWLVVFLLLAAFWRFIMAPLLLRIAKKTHVAWGETLVKAFLLPLFLQLIFFGVLVFISLFPFTKEIFSASFLGTLRRAGSILFIAWGILGASDIVSNMLSGASGLLTRRTGKSLVIFLTRLYQALVLIFSGMMLLSEFHFNISGILTGLGLGSLTFALAAQDVASNFFGGLVLILDHPFEVGDWISTDVVEGTVEDIAFRTTKVRTLNDAITIIPNNKLSSGVITNWTRLNKRLGKFTLGLMYATTQAVVEKTLSDFRAMLQTHEKIYDDSVIVRLDNFSSSSIDIFVQFYAKTTSIVEYRAIKEEINLNIMRIMEQNHASFAFPTYSIYFENDLVQRKALEQ